MISFESLVYSFCRGALDLVLFEIIRPMCLQLLTLLTSDVSKCLGTAVSAPACLQQNVLILFRVSFGSSEALG